MLLWFAGLSLVLVWQVFRDPAIDYRLVVAGALLPDVVDALIRGAAVLHTLAASVALLVLVMVATRGRRPWRRRLLAVPIGTFLHLLLDGMWAHTEAFWWPFFGWELAGGLPSFSRPAAVVVVQELAGAAAVGWWVRRFGLTDAGNRRHFLATGRLPRAAQA